MALLTFVQVLRQAQHERVLLQSAHKLTLSLSLSKAARNMRTSPDG